MHSSSPCALTAIGWRGPPPQARTARVVAQHRSAYIVDDGEQQFSVSAPAALIRAGIDADRRPAVGDFVELEPAPATHIARLLPRRSALKRAAAGERYKTQVIAANVDTVLVVCGLDDDFNLRRIERYLVLARESGAVPVVVLTKADKRAPEETEPLVAAALARAGGAPVLAVNAKDPATATALAPWLGPGDTAVLVGSSGAGKSTLTNTLLGHERQATQATRESDGRGRHTTTQRNLLRLDGGACLIDTPGMRELKLTGDEDVGEIVFADIESLAADCRFRDCRHEAEPGCAVQAAIAAGTLDPERLAHQRKLAAERASAVDQRLALAARKADVKVKTRALHRRLDDKRGGH
jgi:ribosome biogenesis GTPase